MSRKRMGIGAKLILQLVIVLLFFAGISFFMVTNLLKTSDQYDSILDIEVAKEVIVLEIEVNMLEMRRHEKDFLMDKTEEDIDLNRHHNEEILSLIEKLKQIGNDERYDRISQFVQQYDREFINVSSAVIEMGVDEESGLQGQFREAVHDVEELVAQYESVFADLLMLRRHEKDYLLRRDEAKYKPRVQGQIELLKDDVSALDLDDRSKLVIYDKLDQYEELFLRLIGLDNAISAYTKDMKDAVHQIEPLIVELVQDYIQAAQDKNHEVENTVRSSVRSIIIFLIIALALMVIVDFLIIISITKPVRRIANELSSASFQLSSASSQLTSTSQQIASGASEQASGLEETSSSLEEISTMVSQSANNAVSLSQLANKSSEQSKSGLSNAREMLSSMEELNSSTDDIKNIIQVIESIAFQTNILALNAAVEAARAGDAGMGFAVVADEVKSLANKSTESAKETAELIQGSIEGINLNLAKAREVSELFADLENQGMKVFDMSREVEEASKQQSSGFDQINKAITQLDQVVQLNASASEEAASSSEELSAQAVVLEESVNELMQIIDGGRAKRRRVSKANSIMLEKPVPDETGIKIYGREKAEIKKESGKGEDLIPFDGEDFAEF